MTVTRWPQAIQRETCPYRLVPVPPPWGCVQSRSVSSRMWRGARELSSWGTAGRKVPLREAEGSASVTSIDCGRVPSVCRRIVVLLVVALLGVGGVGTTLTAAEAQQGAGDQQYEDPFGGSGSDSGSGSGSSNSGSGSSGGGSGAIDPITPAPQTSGGSSSGTASANGSSATTSPSSPAATGQLPNTGLDTRVLVL